MSPRVFVAFVGALLIVGGVFLGLLLPVSVAGPGGVGRSTVDCGAAWSQFSDGANLASALDPSSHDYRVDCRGSRGVQGSIAVGLLAVGALSLVGAGFVKRRPQGSGAGVIPA